MLRINNLIGFGVSAGAAEAPEASEAVSFDGSTDYLSGQSFAGSNLDVDLYYVSGTVPFGLAAPPLNTWTRYDVTGSYTVENIGQNFKGRMANLTLDASVDMPMKDAATAHINNGTGGNFTQNGVLDTASRGPNQDNCVASGFDGVNDYLTTDLNMVNFSVFTLSFYGKTVGTSQEEPLSFGLFNNEFFLTRIGGGYIQVLGYDSSHVICFNLTAQVPEGIGERSTHLSISIDLSDINKCIMYLNGSLLSNSYISTIVNTSVYMATSNIYNIGKASNGATYYDGSLGELYFDTTYTDLSIDNPFWDSELNSPNSVTKVIADTAATPLIAIPIRADDPGNNDLGTGGAFTVNSGPFIGARGGSEFWARSAVVDASDYLTGSVYCESLVKWLSTDAGVTWTPTYSNAVTVTNIGNGTDNGVVAFYWGTSEDINWALEANKNRVTDQLGYPKDLAALVADNVSTVLALPFDDTTNFGKNLIGADFTMTGTITQGADVTA